ncbi:MAG: B12-binding domain-containing radical SAM protein [Bacteroidales bacterium]
MMNRYSDKIVLITPPFTQLNTPYPATAYIKGFLNEIGINSFQTDLSLETMLKILSSDGLKRAFDFVEQSNLKLSEFASTVMEYRLEYENSIDNVIAFLQGKRRTLAYSICHNNYLPIIDREIDDEELEWAFGTLGLEDKARHLATIYLEEITTFIKECVDNEFGFSRYAEQMARCASSYDEIESALSAPLRFSDEFLIEALNKVVESREFEIAIITIPFPGNLYSGLRIAQWLKINKPHLKIIMGGGFVNTELRQINDPRLFEIVDYLLLDDAEDSLPALLDFIAGNVNSDALVRCFLLEKENGKVSFFDKREHTPCSMEMVGTPDYSDLELDKYISLIERLNPMHKLWSDGRWNKLTLAHGCYWGKCSFCDCSLDYISRYAPNSAKIIVDRIEKIIKQTGENGFHFVDEAAPPAVVKAVANEIIARNLKIVWWGNIRFEKSFNDELCELMKESGCIAVSGGIEVASDRILRMINKGVSLEQVSKVTRSFSEAGILVHAYLMYGFPTQTDQETIDSLEIVRQLFKLELIHSAFWHRFALTAHSPVGLNPEKFNIKITEPDFKGFARNDLQFNDPTGGDHDKFGQGLRVSLYNFMNGNGFDLPLNKWFNTKVPRTTIPPNFIMQLLKR